MKKGVLLVNLGTPRDCTKASIRRYLKEFLMDYRVVSLPFFVRFLLVYGVILPFRPKETTKAYQAIWCAKGSPLLLNSISCKDRLKDALGTDFQVVIAMRYGTPSIRDGLNALEDVDELIIIPLFPQYASATTGSVVEKVMSEIKRLSVFPNLRMIRDFYKEPLFIKAQAELIKAKLTSDAHLLLSYHGLPERQLKAIHCKCYNKQQAKCESKENSDCYRKQCLETSRLLQQYLGISPSRITSAFQSKLGRTPWIKPYTDETLSHLREMGIENLVVACPSFVADCLETLEEIGIRLKEQWLKLGGLSFTLVPCVNDESQFIDALKSMISKENLHGLNRLKPQKLFEASEPT